MSTDTQWRATYDTGEAAAVRIVDDRAGTRPAPTRNADALADMTSASTGSRTGRWEPNHPNYVYFLTTEGRREEGEYGLNGAPTAVGSGRWAWQTSRSPMPVGRWTLLLNGSEVVGDTQTKMNKPDNMTIDAHGNLLIQEDPGNVDPPRPDRGL